MRVLYASNYSHTWKAVRSQDGAPPPARPRHAVPGSWRAGRPGLGRRDAGGARLLEALCPALSGDPWRAGPHRPSPGGAQRGGGRRPLAQERLSGLALHPGQSPARRGAVGAVTAGGPGARAPVGAGAPSPTSMTGRFRRMPSTISSAQASGLSFPEPRHREPNRRKSFVLRPSGPGEVEDGEPGPACEVDRTVQNAAQLDQHLRQSWPGRPPS